VQEFEWIECKDEILARVMTTRHAKSRRLRSTNEVQWFGPL